eukprot:2743538-Amphidinium_carterae.1
MGIDSSGYEAAKMIICSALRRRRQKPYKRHCLEAERRRKPGKYRMSFNLIGVAWQRHAGAEVM